MYEFMDFQTDRRFAGIEPFKTKVWLSSPTMHGDEQKWVDEALQSNWPRAKIAARTLTRIGSFPTIAFFTSATTLEAKFRSFIFFSFFIFPLGGIFFSILGKEPKAPSKEFPSLEGASHVLIIFPNAVLPFFTNRGWIPVSAHGF